MRVPAALASRVAIAALLAPAILAWPGGSPQAGRAPAICFAPGTSPDYVRSVYAAIARRAPGVPPILEFQLSQRWQATATNGCCLGQGQPTTLTWSVVPDGTPIIPTGQIPGESSDPSDLRAFLDGIYGNESVWRPVLQSVFDRWSALTGITYVFEPSDTGSAIGPSSPGGQLGVRGDIRISGHSIDGDVGILAYNYFPDNGDMVIDTADSFLTNTNNNSIRLRNTVSHEHGHGQGYDHVCPIDQTKLMEPFLATSFDGPQHDDILAGNRGYGDHREDNDASGSPTNLGSIPLGVTTIGNVGADDIASVDDSGDPDYYRFTIAGPRTLSVTLTPFGFTYLEGPQLLNGNCSPGTNFNSLTLSNLDVQVLASNGTTVLANGNSHPAGQAETISNLTLAAAGNYFVRVVGASAQVQLYTLDLNLANANVADLSISKSDGQASEVPGTPVTYTIVASNAGPLAASGATVSDTLPAALQGATWTCSASAGSSCPASGSGNINVPVNLAMGGSATFALSATVSATASGTLVNTASVAPPGGLPDPNAANNSATDSDTLLPQANLAITKTDGQPTAVPGLPVTYTINVTNPGPSTVAATVSDTPPGLIGATWTCSATIGSSCTPSGSGAINDPVTVAAGGTLTYQLTGTVSATATGVLLNGASVTPGPGVTDPNLANNSASDTDLLTPTADVGVTKTDGQATAVPGLPVTYTIVVTSAGPSTVGVTVQDNPPAGLTGISWTCAASPGSACTASGSGPITDPVTIAAGGTLTYLMTGTVAPSAVGSLANTVLAGVPPGTTDPNVGNNVATDTDTLTPQADLGVTKTDSQATAVPGAPLTYQIAVTSAGPSSAAGATVTDPVPAALTGVTWTCTASASSTCPPNGSGSIGHSVTLAPGGVLTYTVTGTVDPAATGSLANTVTVAAPAGVADPVSGNDTATDTDSLTPEADLRITKSDGQLQATPGGPATYVIVASNPGPSDAPGASVADAFPSAVTGVSWTCSSTGAGASCGAPSGSGNIAETVALPAGGSVQYTASGTVDAAATGTLVNTATVTAPASVAELEPSDNSATDVDNLTLAGLSELAHGTVRTSSLESLPGPLEAVGYYWVSQAPRSSYEVIVDGFTGSITSGAGPRLDLLAGDASTVVQPSVAIGAGTARSLRFENASPAARSDQLVRVQSDGCTTACGPEAVYRVRAFETTFFAPRFNNSGTQITVLVVQNRTASPVNGHVWFRGASGALIATQTIAIPARGVATLNTAAIAPSSSGNITISHDGPYGALSGKAVAVEPATGFTFDTALQPRQR